ncbi:MAG: hypothetical protein Q9157_004638 [Trypethelium eluteriae]
MKASEPAGTGSKRLACDRCHSQKLRCASDSSRSDGCARCLRANVKCKFSSPSRMGRPFGTGKSRDTENGQTERSVVFQKTTADPDAVSDNGKRLHNPGVSIRKPGDRIDFHILRDDAKTSDQVNPLQMNNSLQQGNAHPPWPQDWQFMDGMLENHLLNSDLSNSHWQGDVDSVDFGVTRGPADVASHTSSELGSDGSPAIPIPIEIPTRFQDSGELFTSIPCPTQDPARRLSCLLLEMRGCARAMGSTLVSGQEFSAANLLLIANYVLGGKPSSHLSSSSIRPTVVAELFRNSQEFVEILDGLTQTSPDTHSQPSTVSQSLGTIQAPKKIELDHARVADLQKLRNTPSPTTFEAIDGSIVLLASSCYFTLLNVYEPFTDLLKKILTSSDAYGSSELQVGMLVQLLS